MSTTGRYAENTTVAVSKSMEQVEKNLAGIGVAPSDMLIGRRPLVKGEVTFRWRARMYRFELPIPGPDDPLVCQDGRGRRKSPSQVQAAQEQEERRVWRVLERLTRFLPELIEMDCLDPEKILLGFALLQSGETVSEHFERLVASGNVPLLAPPREGGDGEA